MMMILLLCVLTATLAGAAENNNETGTSGCLIEEGRHCSWDTAYKVKCSSSQGNTGAGCVVNDKTKCSWGDDLSVSCKPNEDKPKPQGIRIVTLKFNGTLDIHVGTTGNRPVFINLILNFLSKILKIPKNRITNMNLKAGSIIATFTVLPDPQGLVPLDNAIEDLKRRVDSGPVILLGADGTILSTNPLDPLGAIQIITEVGSCTTETCQTVDSQCIDGKNYMCTCQAGRSGDFCDQDEAPESTGLSRRNIMIIVIGVAPLLILILGIIIYIVGSTTAKNSIDKKERGENFTKEREEGFKQPKRWAPQRGNDYQQQGARFNYYDKM